MAARLGSKPKRPARTMVQPIATLLIFMAICAFLSGLMAYFLASHELIRLPEPLFARVPQGRHVAFLTDSVTHLASYGVGFVGGITLIITTLRWRRRHSSQGKPT